MKDEGGRMKAVSRRQKQVAYSTVTCTCLLRLLLSFAYCRIQPRMGAFDVRNPDYLAIELHTLETIFRQVLFFQAEKSKVRQVAQNGLKPPMFAHNFAYSGVLELVYVIGQHGYVLRCSRGGDRVENRF